MNPIRLGTVTFDGPSPRVPGAPGDAGIGVGEAEELLAAAQSIGIDANHPGVAADSYRELIAKIRPDSPFPEDIGLCSVLALAHESLAVEHLAADETEDAIESLHSVAVLSLILDDADMRGRALAFIADLHEGAGRPDEMRRELTNAAVAFTAAGRADEAATLLDRRDGKESTHTGVFGAGPESRADGTGVGPASVSDGAADGSDATGGEWDAVADAAEESGAAEVMDELRAMIDAAGSGGGPSDAQITRAMPLLFGASDAHAQALFRSNRTENLEEDVARAVRAIGAIDDPSLRERAEEGLLERLGNFWEVVYRDGVAALSRHDGKGARTAFSAIVENREADFPPSSDQIGRAYVGLVAEAVARGNELLIKAAALEAANGIDRLPGDVERAVYGEQLAGALSRVDVAVRMRMKLLSAAAVTFRDAYMPTEEIRCLIALALCKVRNREYAAAHDELTELSERARALDEFGLFAEARLNLGRSWAFANRHEMALRCFDEVISGYDVDDLESPADRVRYAALLLEKARMALTLGAASGMSRVQVREIAERARTVFRAEGALSQLTETEAILATLP